MLKFSLSLLYAPVAGRQGGRLKFSLSLMYVTVAGRQAGPQAGQFEIFAKSFRGRRSR